MQAVGKWAGREGEKEEGAKERGLDGWMDACMGGWWWLIEQWHNTSQLGLSQSFPSHASSIRSGVCFIEGCALRSKQLSGRCDALGRCRCQVMPCQSEAEKTREEAQRTAQRHRHSLPPQEICLDRYHGRAQLRKIAFLYLYAIKQCLSGCKSRPG